MKQRLRTTESWVMVMVIDRRESRDQNGDALVLQGEKARGQRSHEIANSSSQRKSGDREIGIVLSAREAVQRTLR